MTKEDLIKELEMIREADALFMEQLIIKLEEFEFDVINRCECDGLIEMHGKLLQLIEQLKDCSWCNNKLCTDICWEYIMEFIRSKCRSITV